MRDAVELAVVEALQVHEAVDPVQPPGHARHAVAVPVERQRGAEDRRAQPLRGLVGGAVELRDVKGRDVGVGVHHRQHDAELLIGALMGAQLRGREARGGVDVGALALGLPGASRCVETSSCLNARPKDPWSTAALASAPRSAASIARTTT